MATVQEYLMKMDTLQLLHLLRMDLIGQMNLDGRVLVTICQIITDRADAPL